MHIMWSKTIQSLSVRVNNSPSMKQQIRSVRLIRRPNSVPLSIRKLHHDFCDNLCHQLERTWKLRYLSCNTAKVCVGVTWDSRSLMHTTPSLYTHSRQNSTSLWRTTLWTSQPFQHPVWSCCHGEMKSDYCDLCIADDATCKNVEVLHVC